MTIKITAALLLPLVMLTACFDREAAELTSADVGVIASEYDAKLAKALGADAYGMRSYVMVILKTGPNDKTITDEAQRAKIFAGHFSNMKVLTANKKLVLAGPFGDPDNIKRGLYIFNVKTVDEAKALVMTDPAVKAGIFTPDFTPYYGSAALVQVNSIHKKIAKENPG